MGRTLQRLHGWWPDMPATPRMHLARQGS
jgi:hypothetical protein